MNSSLRFVMGITLAVGLDSASRLAADEWITSRPRLSRIYPHLAIFSDDGECGTGAVVPRADRLWIVTYSQHKSNGSSDKLYEINAALTQTIQAESVGGTPANRMIHAESQQLLIGPYAIDTNRHVRVLTPKVMPGRITGTARHLTDSANKACYATMEVGYRISETALAWRNWARLEKSPG